MSWGRTGVQQLCCGDKDTVEIVDVVVAAWLHQVTFLFGFGGQLHSYLLAFVNKTR